MATNVLFILGALRSGSTVFEQYLARSPGTVAAGEVVQVWAQRRSDTSRCTCGEPFDSCPLWPAVMAGVDRQMGGRDEVERIVRDLRQDLPRWRSLIFLHHQWSQSRSFSQRYGDEARLLGTLYGEIAARTGASLILDGSKTAAYGHLLGTLDAAQVAFVLLIRDSRAVVHSWRQGRVVQRPDGGRAELSRWSTGLAVRHWMRENLVGVGLAPYAGARMLTITYEEFVRDPDATVARVNDLLSRLGMPMLGQPDLSGFSDRYHSVAGNPARFNPGAPIVEDTRWRTEMPRGERLAVSVATAPVLLAHHVLTWRRTGQIAPKD